MSMDVATSGLDPDDYLDVLGQQPGLQIYTQICLVYKLKEGATWDTVLTQSRLIQTLSDGLARLSRSFPWIAGQVVNEGSRDGNTGVFKIKALEKTPLLVVKDLRNTPSNLRLHLLEAAKFPMSMLDENFICAANTLPGNETETPIDRARVFSAQVNLIDGETGDGFVLSFCGHHLAMDMVGQGQVMRLFHKACCNEPFTTEELAAGNMTRRNIIPLLDVTYEPGPELRNQIPKAIPDLPDIMAKGGKTASPPKCTWITVRFDSEAITALKSAAIKSTSLPLGAYFSKDDALTALIWQSITRARLPRLGASIDVRIARAVDVRRYMGIPQVYPGLMQNMAYNSYSLRKLVDAPLGAVALALRSQVDPAVSDIAFRTRALATYLSRSADKGITNFIALIDPASDLAFSSWAKIDCFNLDFGSGIGGPIAVQRPLFPEVESLGYLLPKSPDGGFVVVMCLRDEDIAILEADEEFTRYGRFV